MDAISKRNLEAIGYVVELLTWDRETRKRFLDEPFPTLEEIGLSFTDTSAGKGLIDALKEELKKDLVIDQPGAIDPIGPVANFTAFVTVSVAVSPSVNGLALALDVPIARGKFKWDKFKFDHVRINSLRRLQITERRVLAMETALRNRLSDRFGGGPIR